MSDRKTHLEGAVVLSQGNFKLDARRAMEKLAHFQLEDPHRYVLELVAAAVGAGSRSLTIRNDADDLELTWDGDHPTADELESLFDHIFYQGDDPRQRMLQHLAQGIFGALGLGPRWIRLERPGLTLDMTDPVSPVSSDNARTVGVHVHVRERFSWRVIREAISPFDDAYETRLLRALAFLAPLPVEVNGVDITARPPAPPVGAETRSVEGGLLWLHEPGAALDARLQEGVLLVRDGICVQSMPIPLGRHQVVGWVMARSLKLNASRSGVVQDDLWRALQSRLMGHAAELLAGACRRSPDDAELREAALKLLCEQADLRAPFAALPLFRDALGRSYSLAELEEHRVILTVDRPDLPSAEIADPQFLHLDNLKRLRGRSPDAIDSLQWMVIRRELVGRLRDGTSRLHRLEQGRKRRRELARRSADWGFRDAIVSHEFTAGELTGIIALLGGSDSDGISAEIRVDGLPVQTITIKSIASVKARIQGSGLEADEAFLDILDGPTLRSLPVVLLEALDALLCVAAQQAPSEPAVQRALHRRIAQGTVVPEAIQAAPVFSMLHGPSRSLQTITGRAGKRGKIVYVRQSRLSEVAALLVGTEEPEGMADVLLLDMDATRALKRVFARRLSDRSDQIIDTLRALQRRRQPPVIPMLLGGLDAKCPVREEGISGEIGLLSSPTVPAVRVIHQGVDLGRVEIPLELPGAIGSVSWDAARPNTAWDGLADPGRQARQLAELLSGPLHDLAEHVVGQWRERSVLPEWVVATLSRPLSEAHARQLWFRTLAGEPRSLEYLKTRSPIYYLSQQPDTALPGLEDVLLLDDARRRILEAHVSPVLSAEPKIDKLLRARSRYFTQPLVSSRLPDRGRFVCRAWLRSRELSGEIGIQAEEGALEGILIQIIAHSRLLTELKLPHFLPIVAVVEGSGVRPDARLTGVEDSAAIQALVEEAVEPAVTRLIADPEAPESLQRLLLHRLLLGRSLPGVASDEERARLLAALRQRPLFPCLSGGSATLDELAAALDARRMVVVLSPGSPPPDDRLWVKVTESRLALLKLALGQRLPDGESELRAWQKARQRRESIPTTTLIPDGRFAATWLLEEDGARAWVALAAESAPGLTLEWHIDQRILRTEQHPCTVPLRIRIADPAVQPDRAFEGPAHGPERRRATDWALSLPARFMLGVACEARILAPREVTRARPGAPMIFSPERCRRWSLRWAADAPLSEAWTEAALLRTASGERLTPIALRAIAALGPIRVVGTATQGQTLDPARPAVQCDEADHDFLKPYGELTDFTRELSREAMIQERRSRPPRRQSPQDGAHVLLTRPVPGAREGFLQVLTDGTGRVGLHVGWRWLGEGVVPGVVPLFGHISDDALTPDTEFVRVERDAAWRALMSELSALSDALLPELLDVTDPIRHRDLLLAVLARAFRSRGEVRDATGSLGRLADLPLLRSGTDQPLSARQLAAAPPRWVTPGERWPSLDERRPFVCATPEEQTLLQPLLGGSDETRRAEREREVLSRQHAEPRPFEVPRESLTPPVTRTWGSYRGIFGLAGGLLEGEVEVRCDGVPVAHLSPALPGLVGVIEVPRRVVSEDWQSARLSSPTKKGMSAVHEGLVEDAASAIRAAPDLSRWVARLIAGRGVSGASAFLSAPLLETLDGPLSIDALRARVRRGATLLIGTAAVDVPDTLIVRADSGGEPLLDAAGLQYVEARTWLSTHRLRSAEEERLKAEKRQRQREHALAASIRRHHVALLGDISGMTKSAIRELPVTAEGCALWEEALEEPDGPAALIVSAWLAERVVSASDHALLMVRLGELISRRATDDTAR